MTTCNCGRDCDPDHCLTLEDEMRQTSRVATLNPLELNPETSWQVVSVTSAGIVRTIVRTAEDARAAVFNYNRFDDVYSNDIVKPGHHHHLLQENPTR